MVLVVICLIALSFLILDNLQGFPKATARPDVGAYPDATVYISTLIVVYAALITVQGLLLPIVLEHKIHDRWKLVACAASGLAIAADLWRIHNSLHDLYSTTIRALDLDHTYDAGYEFRWYFYANLVAILVALIALVLGRQVTANSGGRSHDHT